MSQLENEERTPLVYEDRVRSSSTIETDAGRRCNRNICITLTAICLAVGLVLAVALPITMTQGKGATTNPVSLHAKLLSESVAIRPTQTSNGSSDQKTDISVTDNMSTSDASSSASSSFSSSSSSSPSFSISSHSDSPASSPSSVFSPSNTSTVSSTPITTFPPDLFASCNTVQYGRRSAINLEQLNGKPLFELYRVQSRNSPGYASGISCSVMELDFGSSTNATVSKEGTMKLKWMESGFRSRYPRTIDVNLERSQRLPNDWTETSASQSNAKGRLSLLVQIFGYLLTYECFPSVSSLYPGPAYAIHLYSMVPWTGNTYVATSLMTLANTWGLNPAEEPLTPISHRYCSI